MSCVKRSVVKQIVYSRKRKETLILSFIVADRDLPRRDNKHIFDLGASPSNMSNLNAIRDSCVNDLVILIKIILLVQLTSVAQLNEL